MPLTDFRPELDHVDASAAWRVAPEDEQRVAAQLRDAARGAMEVLQRAFPAAAAFHRLAERLLDAPDVNLAPVLRPDRASAVAAVDHFLTRTPQPSRVSASGRLRRMNAFLWSRVEAWLGADCVQAVAWDAVLRWIPDPWVPIAGLTRALEREARASGAFESIAISLDLRPPGGAPWLRERTLEAWAELRAHLDAGVPRPIDLFLEAPGGMGARPPQTVVAYGYELEGGTALTIHVYDPRHGAVARRLRFDLGAPALAGADASELPGAAVVRGFRCHAYEAVRPPVFGLARLLRLLGLEHVAWRRARRREQRRLGTSAPTISPAPLVSPAPPPDQAPT